MEYHEKLWDTRQDGKKPKYAYSRRNFELSYYMAVKLNTFHCLCLRRILQIRWQQKMTNKSVIELAEINDISCELSRTAWNWLGHILRREGEDDSFTALGWAPKGRGMRGRPKTTWRRTVGKERNKAGWKSSWT
ncbi:unnamed protein product, partial [Porites lobata]